MSRGEYPVILAVSELYAHAVRDPRFDEVAAALSPADDMALAELIEADARHRLSRNLDVNLDRYLLAVPDLPARPDALDAAIDMAVRSLARTSRIDDQTVETLIKQYPELAPAIREAADLGEAVWSTTGLQSHFAVQKSRDLPCEFGPTLPSTAGRFAGQPRYELHELLGQGAFGQVYRAVDRALSEPDRPAWVAIKIRMSRGEKSQVDRHRMHEEATKARRVEHPNVVRVIDRGVTFEDEDFIVYEFVDGGDLGRWLRRHRSALSPADLVSLTARIARGVHAAHMAGLVHCDLKPSNIIMTSQGEPKVADFGIAVRGDERRTRGPAPAEPASSGPLGNLAFMSPQQYRAEPGAATIPSDIYALGGIMFWLLADDYPNGCDPKEIGKTHDTVHGRQAPPPLRSALGPIDDTLEAVCQRAMALKPGDRYGSAGALADDLDAWLRHEPLGWMRPSPWQRLRLWTKRKPAVAASILVIALIVIASAFMLQRMASIANQKRFEAAVSAERDRVQKEAMTALRTTLTDYAIKMRSSMARLMPEESLTSLWILEWLYGPTVLGEELDRSDLWKHRTDIVRSLLAEARAAGGGQSLEALLWQTSLALWLIKTGEHAEALTLLDQSIPVWRQRLPADDRWLGDLEAMRLCAEAGRLAAAIRASPNDPAAREPLPSALDQLSRAAESVESSHPGSPLHRLLLSTMRTLVEPDLLNQPETLAGLDATLKSMRARSQSAPASVSPR